MKTFNNQAAQGDMLIRRIDKLPENVTKIEPEHGEYILTHSESGHHHIVRMTPQINYYSGADTFCAYLTVANKANCLVEHKRQHDTHEKIKIPAGIFEIRRQREYTPQGFRRAQD